MPTPCQYPSEHTRGCTLFHGAEKFPCVSINVQKKKMLHSYSYCLPCARSFLYLPLFEMSATESVSKCIRPPEWQYKWGLAAVDATDNFQKTTPSLMLFWEASTVQVWRGELPDGYLSFPMNWNCEFSTENPAIWYWSWSKAPMMPWHTSMLA